MLHALARNWPLVVFRGVLSIIFGILAFVMPGVTFLALVMLFGAYALIDGVFILITGFRTGASQKWALILEGVIGIAAGLATLAWPNITALVLIYLIAAWALVTGILEIVASIHLWKTFNHTWLLLVAGIVSVVFGVYVFAQPAVGAVAVVLWVGAYALLFGVTLIGFGLRLRHWTRKELAAPGHSVSPA